MICLLICMSMLADIPNLMISSSNGYVPVSGKSLRQWHVTICIPFTSPAQTRRFAQRQDRIIWMLLDCSIPFSGPRNRMWMLPTKKLISVDTTREPHDGGSLSSYIVMIFPHWLWWFWLRHLAAPVFSRIYCDDLPLTEFDEQQLRRNSSQAQG